MTDVNLLYEVIQALREMSRQLDRLASQLERLPTSASVPVQVSQRFADGFRPDSDSLTQKLKRYCEARGVQLVEHAPEQPLNAVERERRHLARFMVERYALLAPLLGLMRGTLASPRKVLRKVANLNGEQLGIVTNVLTRLHQLYMLDHYKYDCEGRVVSFRVRKQPFAQNFLSVSGLRWGLQSRSSDY